MQVGDGLTDVPIAADDPGAVLYLLQKPDHQPEPRGHHPLQRVLRLGAEACGEQGPRQVGYLDFNVKRIDEEDSCFSSQLAELIPKSQEELPQRTMRDSLLQARIPIGSNPEVGRQ